MESSHCSCKVKNGLEKDEDGYGKIHSGRLLKQNNKEIMKDYFKMMAMRIEKRMDLHFESLSIS